MSDAISRPPRFWVLLAVVGVLICALALWLASGALAGARRDTLSRAYDEAAPALAHVVDTQMTYDAASQILASLLVRPDASLTYLTLINSQGAVLASRGAYAGYFGWLSESSAREWRSWLYRAFSAETRRALTGNRQGVTVRYGVGWLTVIAAAGLSFWLDVLLIGIGVLVCATGVRRFRSAVSVEETTTLRPSSVVPDKSRSTTPAPSGSRLASLSRVLLPRLTRGADRGRALSRGFERIGVQPGDAAATPKPPEANDNAPVVPPTRRPTPTLSSPASSQDSSQPLAVAPVEQRTKPVSTAAAVPAARVSTREQRPAATPAEPVGAAETVTLGDQTLDLRFFPIWRGREQATLAGAWATLAWRSGKGEIVDPETLTRLAEKEGALGAFAQWIAMRFSVLHANWRSLELLTVPIVLPVPNALFNFADAEAVWQDALHRIDRDPHDLLLHVSQSMAQAGAALALPVRRVLAAGSATLASTGDVIYLAGDSPTANGASPAGLAEDASTPLLVGPLEDPDRYQNLIEQTERVAWFSDKASQNNLHTPRSFARLLARHAVAPL